MCTHSGILGILYPTGHAQKKKGPYFSTPEFLFMVGSRWSLKRPEVGARVLLEITVSGKMRVYGARVKKIHVDPYVGS